MTTVDSRAVRRFKSLFDAIPDEEINKINIEIRNMYNIMDINLQYDAINDKCDIVFTQRDRHMGADIDHSFSINTKGDYMILIGRLVGQYKEEMTNVKYR